MNGNRGCVWIIGALLFFMVLFAMVMYWILVVGVSAPSFNKPGGNPPGGGPGGAPTSTPSHSASPSTGATAGAPSVSPGPGTTMPIISARDYGTGSAPLTMTGAFTFDSASPHDAFDGYSDGERTKLWYGIDAYDPDGFIEIAFSSVGEEGFGLTILRDPWVATYLGEGCTWQVEVTEAVVSGHISCSDIPAENQADSSSGTVDIELDFVANTR